MENKIFLGKYRLSIDENGAPVELRRNRAGVTYQAEQVGSGLKIALEVVPSASLRIAAREQLETEALAAQQLGHINIPALYDFGFEGHDLVYVTEYFDGTTAEDWVEEQGPMPVAAVLRIALQVVSALGAAAFHRIVHHAINPSNLLFVPGQAVEGDWPLVKVLHFIGVAPTFSGADVSVAAFDKAATFASPEQLQQGIVDFRSEIYSLGSTMWFLLTGAPPITIPADSLEMQPTKMSLAVEQLSGVPKTVRRLLAQMLSANRDERPLDPLALEEQLRDCLSQVERREAISRRFGIPATSGTGAIERPTRRRIPVKALTLAAVLFAIAALAALVVPERFWPSRLLQAETQPEPVGIPIGIPDASIAPASAHSESVAAARQTQPSSTASSITSGAEADIPANNANTFSTATDSTAVASANQFGATPMQPESPNPATNAHLEQSGAPAERRGDVSASPAGTPSVVAAAIGTTPVQAPLPNPPTNTSAEQSAPLAASDIPAAAERAEPPAEGPGDVIAGSGAIASANATAPAQSGSPNLSANVHGKQPVPFAGSEVSVPADPSEPVPPAEAPADLSANSKVDSEQHSNSVLQTDANRDLEPVFTPPATASSSSTEQRKDAAPAVASKARGKTNGVAKSAKASKKTAGTRKRVAKTRTQRDGAMLLLPQGMAHARFVGTTRDGRWLLVLPSSHQIFAVPPPPDFQP